jgi:hypothetical protein
VARRHRVAGPKGGGMEMAICLILLLAFAREVLE